MNNLRKYIKEILLEGERTSFADTEMVGVKIAYRIKYWNSRDLLTQLRAVPGVVTVNQDGAIKLVKKGVEYMTVDMRFMVGGKSGEPSEKDAKKLLKKIKAINGVYFVKLLTFGDEDGFTKAF